VKKLFTKIEDPQQLKKINETYFPDHHESKGYGNNYPMICGTLTKFETYQMRAV